MALSAAWKFARWAAIALATPLILFALSAWIGALIPRNATWQEPETGTTILIGTNGVHTEIVMPLSSPHKDWRGTFPASDIAASDRAYTHVAVSWGERAFFLETPSWSEFDPIRAGRALIGGEPLLHVAHYVRPAPSADYRKLTLRDAEYRALVKAIAGDLAASPEILPGYGAHDVFYTARGTYSLTNTCNQWTSDRLSTAGVKTGFWTPLAGGVMQWAPQ